MKIAQKVTFVALLLAACCQSWADEWQDIALSEQKLLASDGVANANYGRSVAVEGDRLLVGAFLHNPYGQAYVYDQVNGAWQESILQQSDPYSNDYFGHSVALQGDWAFVGTSRDNHVKPNAGTVYTFKKINGTWVEQQKLSASTPVHSGYFGYAMDISGDWLLVSGENVSGGTGSAYLFQKSGENWTEHTILSHTELDGGDYFGHSVAIDGGRAVVSAYKDEAGALTQAGAVYTFQWNGSAWVDTGRLTHPNPSASDWFGNSVSLSGNVLVVGSPYDDEAAADGGSAVIYRHDGTNWVEEKTLYPPTPGSSLKYGWTVSLKGETLVVGQLTDATAGANSGRSIVYRYNASTSDWDLKTELMPTAVGAQDFHTHAIALGDDWLATGAYGDDDNGSAAGMPCQEMSRRMLHRLPMPSR